MEKENNEDNTNISNSSKGVALSSPSRKLKRKIISNDELPWDVLDTIAKKVDFDELFQFTAVCKNWRIFHRSYWMNFMASQEPLVIQTSLAMDAYSLFSIPEQKVVLDYFHVKGFYYSGYSNGYMIMVAPIKNKLMLINPFTRRMKAINTPPLEGNFPNIGCKTLLASIKGSDEFVIVALGDLYQSIHIYHSRNSRWIKCSTQGNLWLVVGCLVLHNNIYVITNKARIGVLTLNPPSSKFLNLHNTPKIYSSIPKLVNYNGQLLVVDFEPKKTLNVYKIDFSAMAYVKLGSLGDFALFYGWTRCYALSNPRKWGYENNFVYCVTRSNDGCKVYSEDNKMQKCILPPRLPDPTIRSRHYWVDWCFRNQHDEISLVE